MFLKHHWKVDCIRFCVLLVKRTEDYKSSSFPHAHDAVIASSNQERLVWVLSHCAHGPRVETQRIHRLRLIITHIPIMHRNQVIYHNVAVLASRDEVLVGVVEHALDLELFTHMTLVPILHCFTQSLLIQQRAALPLEQHQGAGGCARHDALVVAGERHGAHGNYA